MDLIQYDVSSIHCHMVSSSKTEIAVPCIFDSAVEGWTVFVSGLHEEATEDYIYEKFAESGDIRTIDVAIDRITGYLKARKFRINL